jgi:hypothetical protein
MKVHWQGFGTRYALAVLTGVLVCGDAFAASDLAYERASAQYRQGRYSDAFGKFLELANGGDADAARVVVFMHTFGPTLYGSYWDLSTDQVEHFTRLTASRKARKQPEFQPSWRPAAGNARRPPGAERREIVDARGPKADARSFHKRPVPTRKS